MILDTILAELRTERERLHRAIAILEGTAPRRGRPRKAQTAAVRPKRRMSASGRKRLSEFKKRWWAARRGRKIA